MIKKIRLAMFFCLVVIFFAGQYGYANDVNLMDRFSTGDWIANGAEVSYSNTENNMKIQKDAYRFKPNWGSVKVELGTINVSDPQENNLSFEIVDLDGLYSLSVHYGGRDQYDSHFIKIQDNTGFTGLRKYNVSEALRSSGLKGEQQIQLEIVVIDNDDAPGGGTLVIKNLLFGYDDNFAVSPTNE